MQEIRQNESLNDLRLELLVIACMRADVFVSAGKRGLTNATTDYY